MILREPIKPVSPINRWDDWPEDVHDELKAWNRERMPGMGYYYRLGFYRGSLPLRKGSRPPRTFRCSICKYLCMHHPNGTATLGGVRQVCDECLIVLARQTIADREHWQRATGDPNGI